MCIRGCMGLLFFKDCSQMFKQSCPPEHNPKPVPVTINTWALKKKNYWMFLTHTAKKTWAVVKSKDDSANILGELCLDLTKALISGPWMSSLKTSFLDFHRLLWSISQRLQKYVNLLFEDIGFVFFYMIPAKGKEPWESLLCNYSSIVVVSNHRSTWCTHCLFCKGFLLGSRF